VPEGDRTDITGVTINIPSISNIYYATGYTIYYRIYISGETTTSTIDSNSDRTFLNPTLDSNFLSLFRFTDPLDTASVATVTTFTSLNFHELEIPGGRTVSSVLTTAGGNLSIHFSQFPGDRPILIIDGTEYYLHRSNGYGSFTPVPDNRLFFNTQELHTFENATSVINADVSGRSGLSAHHAYVSMYIVAVGSHPTNFQRIISNPTFLSIFKLPVEN
jgi:hypothetical protein